MSERSVSAIALGLIFASAPFSFGMLPIEFSFPLMAKILIVLYGALMIAGGLFVGGAERYQSLLDIYSIIGIGLVLAGPITDFVVGQEFWMTITFVTAVFLGLPTALLLRLSKKEA